MRGSYDIVVKDKNVEYNFTVKRKYTVLTGESATGKSKLYKMLENPETFVEVKSEYGEVGIIPLANRRDMYLRLLPCKEPTIFVVDEQLQGFLDIEFKDLMSKSNAYFIIISRKKLVYERIKDNGDSHIESLPLSINEIYTINSTEKKKAQIDSKYYYNTFSNMYSVVEDSTKVSAILTEDSGSGFKIYSHCYNNIDAFTSKGNDNLIAELRKIDKNNVYDGCIAVFLDGAAYGAYIGELLSSIKMCNNKILVFAPESLEWVLLNVIPESDYGQPFDKNILVCSQNYCDNKAFTELVYPYKDFKKSFESWEQLYTNYLNYLMGGTIHPYSKSKKVNNFYLRFSNKILKLISEKL